MSLGTKIFYPIFFFHNIWLVDDINNLLFECKIRDSLNLCLVLTTKLLHKSSLNNLSSLLNQSCRFFMFGTTFIIFIFMEEVWFFSCGLIKQWRSVQHNQRFIARAQFTVEPKQKQYICPFVCQK